MAAWLEKSFETKSRRVDEITDSLTKETGPQVGASLHYSSSTQPANTLKLGRATTRVNNIETDSPAGILSEPCAPSLDPRTQRLSVCGDSCAIMTRWSLEPARLLLDRAEGERASLLLYLLFWRLWPRIVDTSRRDSGKCAKMSFRSTRSWTRRGPMTPGRRLCCALVVAYYDSGRYRSILRTACH